MNRRSRGPEPQQPTPTSWTFPGVDELAPDDDLAAVGADLEPGTILAAYANGFFPMPVSRREIGWFHPDPRGVIPLDGLRVSRSLRRSMQRFTVTVNHDFEAVIDACADPARPMGWIDKRIRRAYTRLHHMGWAHSIEVWEGDVLAGGLYGLALGGLFAGESMFHRRTDASKVALVGLVERLGQRPGALLDVQWLTPHLATLGAVEVARDDYVARLAAALALPLPEGLAG